MLAQDGWVIRLIKSNNLSFGYPGPLESGEPRIDVLVEKEGVHRTRVTVKFLKNG